MRGKRHLVSSISNASIHEPIHWLTCPNSRSLTIPAPSVCLIHKKQIKTLSCQSARVPINRASRKKNTPSWDLFYLYMIRAHFLREFRLLRPENYFFASALSPSQVFSSLKTPSRSWGVQDGRLGEDWKLGRGPDQSLNWVNIGWLSIRFHLVFLEF